MAQYNAKCPLCGTENQNLYLEETYGWFICEQCGSEVNTLLVPQKLTKISVLDLINPIDIIKQN